MKTIVHFFFLILIFFACAVTVQARACDFPQQDTAATSKQSTGKAAKKSAGNATKKIEKAAAALPKDAAKEEKALIKKISDLLKFTSNARKKEKERVITIISGIGIKDSVKADINSLKAMVEGLSENDSKQYVQIMTLIDSIIKIKTPPQEQATKEPEARSAAEVADSVYTEELETDILANNKKDKSTKLNLIRKLAASGGRLKVNSQEGDVVKRNIFRLHKKAQIHGFYSSEYSVELSDVQLRLFDAIVYDALELDGATGDLTGEIDNTFIENAREVKTDIYLTVFASTANTVSLFSSDVVQGNLIKNIVYTVKSKDINGINIHLESLSPYAGRSLELFMSRLADTLKSFRTPYRICMTLPVFDEEQVYNLKVLDSFVNYFYLDFATRNHNTSGPLAPLAGPQNNTISTSLSYYLKHLSPSKLVVNLPYQGAEWVVKPGTGSSFKQYHSYAAIRQDYNDALISYDKKTISAFIDIEEPDMNQLNRIWFDDENTLEQKYELVLENGLAGVGISYIGYDGSYGELQDVLTYKLYDVDTITLTDSSLRLGFFDKLKRRLTLYNYILHNPCEVCFENADGKWDKVIQYTHDLKIDSIVRAQNKDKSINDKTLTYLMFRYINDELNMVVLCISLLLLFLIVITAAIYIRYLRSEGDKWRYKRPVALVLIILIIFLSWSAFAYLFTNDLIPLFGVSGQSFQIQGAETAVAMEVNCQPDPECINVPLHLLMGIILFGSLLGLLVGRLLIFPILKKDNVP